MRNVAPNRLLYTTAPSPVGELLLVGDGQALHGLYMQEGRKPMVPRPAWEPADAPFREVRRQLDEYFAGERTDFELPITMTGTPFDRRVWAELRELRHGETVSYGELARRIGRPATPRAVGHANGRNPISVIVPCHRVLGADGALTGYGGGLERKRLLLDLEAGRCLPGLL